MSGGPYRADPGGRPCGPAPAGDRWRFAPWLAPPVQGDGA